MPLGSGLNASLLEWGVQPALRGLGPWALPTSLSSQAPSRPLLLSLFSVHGTHTYSFFQDSRAGVTASMKPLLTTHFFSLPLCYVQASGLIPLISHPPLRTNFQRAKGSHLPLSQSQCPGGCLITVGGQQTRGGRVPPDLVTESGVPSSQLRSRLSILKSS